MKHIKLWESESESLYSKTVKAKLSLVDLKESLESKAEEMKIGGGKNPDIRRINKQVSVLEELLSNYFDLHNTGQYKEIEIAAKIGDNYKKSNL